MRQRRIWWIGGLALAGVWVVAALGLWIARAQRMTAEKTIAYAHEHRLAEGLTDAQRSKIVDGLADRVNQLSFDERQKFRQQGDMREFFEKMTPAERAHYLDLTLPKGMKQMMEAFNQMPTEKRKQLVNRALGDLNKARDEAGPNDPDRVRVAFSDPTMQKIINSGMESFLKDANADTKLDLQPLIEQMQNIMQTGH
jgi:hypothetical protein